MTNNLPTATLGRTEPVLDPGRHDRAAGTGVVYPAVMPEWGCADLGNELG